VAWFAHLYTASGAATALAAVLALEAGDLRATFLWLALAVVIDATDGVLARALRVKERLPWFDGGTLDNVVDYLTYVFVPALIVVKAGLVPPPLALPLGASMLVASGYGFSRADAKVATTDHFFTGFPSYWNIVAVYLVDWQLPAAANAVILAVLVVLVFVPLRYVYPSRTVTWRPATIALGTMWGVCLMAVISRLPADGGVWSWLALVFPVYYVALSLRLSLNERREAATGRLDGSGGMSS
jgi:phosphatidylcholine synthase